MENNQDVVNERHVAAEGEVGTIKLPKGGTMSGIVCSPHDEIFVSQGSVIWQVNRLDMSLERYAGKPGTNEGREGFRLTDASFHRARDLSVTAAGFYVVDTDANRVFSIVDDHVFFFAGDGSSGFQDGVKLNAKFRSPCSVIVHHDTIIVSDTGNMKIRFIHPDGLVTSIGSSSGNIDGNFETAKFTNPCMLCSTPRDTVLVTDGAMHLLRELDMAKKEVWTLHPDIWDEKQNSSPEAQLSNLSISEPSKTIDHPTLEPRAVKKPKVRGDGIFRCPLGMVFDSEGFLYLANYSDHCILKIDYERNLAQTFIGGDSGDVDGDVAKATLKWPNYITLTSDGDMFWTEHMDYRVRYVRSAVTPSKYRILDNFEYFEQFLETEQTILPSDLAIPCAEVGQPVPCHRSILYSSIELLSFDTNYFEKHHIARNVVSDFLATLYGKKTAIAAVTPEDVLNFARVHKLPYDLKIDAEWGAIFDVRYFSNLRATALPILVSAFKLLVDEYGTECKSVMILAAWLHKAQSKNRIESEMSDWEPSLRSIVANAEGLPVSLSSMVYCPLSPLDFSLRGYAEQLTWMDSSKILHGPSHCPTNFMISNGNGKSIAVHDWVLFCRWSYFKRLINSGLVESKDKTMELTSSSFPSEILLQFLKYIYYGTVSNESKELILFKNDQDCLWILENGAQFEVIDLDLSLARTGFENLVRHCKQSQRRKKAYEIQEASD